MEPGEVYHLGYSRSDKTLCGLYAYGPGGFWPSSSVSNERRYCAACLRVSQFHEMGVYSAPNNGQESAR